MLKIKKLAAMALATVMATSIFVGCGKTKNDAATTDPSKLKEVKLKMYLLGDKPADYDKVYGEVNKVMKEKINATLDVQFLSWGDYQTKYPLLFSSGEDFDMIFTATGWCFYNQMATRNGFLELTQDMLEKYAPNTWKEQPKVAWEQAKVNGKIFMVPNNQTEFSHNVVGIRGDLAEKYGIGQIKTEADLEKYLEAVAKNEKDIVPLVNGGGQNLQWPYLKEANEFGLISGTPQPLIGYKINDNSGKVMSIVDTQEYTDYVVKMKELASKGIWSKNSISSKETRNDAFAAGKAATMVWNIGSTAQTVADINKKHPEWKAQIVDINAGKKKFVNAYTNNGIGINASSKNPERALMALDLLRNNRDIYDLTFYGIKGTHWDAVGDTQYKVLADTAKFPAGNVCPWGWTSSLTRTSVEEPKEVKQYKDKWLKEDTVHNSLEGFTFDDSKVKNEMAAVNNVITQFGVPLDLGMVENTSQGIADYKEKLKNAGLDKIMTEVQSQVDAYLKTLK